MELPHSIFFTILDYPISYLEFFGTVFNLWAVYLTAHRNILAWPVGLVGVVLFGILFYDIRLYADFFEQIYYFITGIYGWWYWKTTFESNAENPFRAHFSKPKEMAYWFLGSLVLSVLTSALIKNIHILWPSAFPEAASFPFLDSATTIFSFTAQILMARKRTESWIYWISIDILGVYVYFEKGVKFVSLLYAIFIVLAFYGFKKWRTVNDSNVRPHAS